MILSYGRVICYGTMEYLSSKMKLGFRLNITMFETNGIKKIEQLVLDNIQDATKRVRHDFIEQCWIMVSCCNKNC